MSFTGNGTDSRGTSRGAAQAPRRQTHYNLQPIAPVRANGASSPASAESPRMAAATQARLDAQWHASQAPQQAPQAQQAPQQSFSAPVYNSPSTGYTPSSVDTGSMGNLAPVSPIPAAVEPPAPVVIPDANADPTYQAQALELARSMSDFKGQQDLASSQYGTNYNEGLRNLGWDGGSNQFDRNNMQGLFGQATDANQNDFAGRGILHSGLFANANAGIGTDFANRKTGLDTAKQQYSDTQGQALQSYTGQNSLQKQAALREAVARISATYGVPLSSVPSKV